MAIDNLNYYSAWLPAGQLTDRYSSNPWCLKSKNLDIFSSSKSVKATAWSNPVNTDLSWVVLVDQTWNLILKTDDNVYDISSWSEVLVYEWVSTNFPTYNVSYNGRLWTYAPAEWGTPIELISKYEWGVVKYFTIFTDRARYSYSALEYKIDSSEIIWSPSWWTNQWDGVFKKNGTAQTTTIQLRVWGVKWLTVGKLFAQASNTNYDTEWNIEITKIQFKTPKYWYNAETSDMQWISDGTAEVTVTDQLDASTDKAVRIPIPLIPDTWETTITITFKINHPTWSTNCPRPSWELILGVEWYDGYYSYLAVDEDRDLEEVWEYYWEKWKTFQVLYNWTEEWVNSATRARVVRYNLEKYMWWANDVNMDVIWMVAWNEQVYMIGNMEWNWYITPCDLSWWRGTPYIAYGCEFKGVTNIDYLMYLVWEDRGISTLWVYNGQELVPVIWWNKDNTTNDIIWVDEQYKFNWKMANYRKNLILTTKDNRIFEYGQTFGGKWWAFIHEIDWEITWLRVKDNDLIVRFEREVSWETVEYETRYQDDTPIKKYNSEWLAVYPIILWNHLLEKEESDLYTSFILPSANTSLEFWGMANHYHFWTFTSSDDYTFSTESSYYMEWAVWDYELKFIERNGNQYTFKLEWDLPVQTTYDMQIIDSEWAVLINYSDFNHFRKIWEITTDKYWEWEFRFHNLNNKLELPRSHSLQVMVKGKGNQNYTPELFALDLVANQRERW